jgi:hypothetical protein
LKGRGEGFEEDGDALEGFVAERALVRRELEGVGDFVGEGGGLFCFGGRGGLVGLVEAEIGLVCTD